MNGEIAESDQAMALDEPAPDTLLPARRRRPANVLTPSNSATTCPFEDRSYWSVDVGGASFADLVWSYETPIPEAEGIRGCSRYNGAST